jgi:hypothetical protein
MRAFLAAREPLAIPVEAASLSLVAYRDPRVPPETTRVFSLAEAERRIGEVMALYPPLARHGQG